ncbi:MAG: NAD(P)H-hydrate epimerase, partial [Candidatus Bathyarchaeia archaeon]
MIFLNVLTSGEMYAEELNAAYLGVSELQLMENAGAAVAREVASRFTVENCRVVVYAGTGGNGGDGFVAARHLAYH